MLSFRPLHFLATVTGLTVKLTGSEIGESGDEEGALRRCGDLAAILREIRNLSRGKRGGEKYRPRGVPKRSSERRRPAHA